jgi:RHH-type rel operon transcriptional repressor/antitoxin RelB
MSLSVRLDADVEQRLKDLANRTGRTTSYYVREALDEYLDDLEDIYLADQRMADIRAGRIEPISDAEMSRRLGLED